MSNRILILGGAGLIGSELVKLLQEDNNTVLVLDSFNSSSVDQNSLGCEVITGNACNLSTLNNCFSYFKPDVIFDFIDHSYDINGFYDSNQEAEEGIVSSLNVIRCLNNHKIEFLFYGSSGEIYKGGSKRPLHEDAVVGNFSYSGAKNFYIEGLYKLASKQYNFNFTSLRFFQVFGNRKHLSSKHDVLTFFIDSLMKREEIAILGPNIYIDSLYFTEAALVSYIIYKEVTRGSLLSVINVGSGVGIKMYDLYRMVCDCLGVDNHRVFVMDSKRQTRSLVADIGLIKKLGFESAGITEEIIKNISLFREKVLNARARPV